MIIWTMMYVALLLECVLIIVLCLPLPTSIRKYTVGVLLKVFKLKVVRTISTAILVIQLMMFFEAMRTINNVESSERHAHSGTERLLLDRIKLLGNQRNAYITGTGAFLWAVTWRLAHLMNQLVENRQEVKARKDQ